MLCLPKCLSLSSLHHCLNFSEFFVCDFLCVYKVLSYKINVPPNVKVNKEAGSTSLEKNFYSAISRSSTNNHRSSYDSTVQLRKIMKCISELKTKNTYHRYICIYIDINVCTPHKSLVQSLSLEKKERRRKWTRNE